MAVRCIDYLKNLWLLCALSSVLCACSPRGPAAANPAPALRPIASIQELMQAEVDASADGVWNAVETVTTEKGIDERRPRTPEEWASVRLSAIALVEAGNLLMMDGRHVGAKEFPAEADGALNSQQIQELITTKRAVFNSFAGALRDTSLTALAAIDAQDPTALVKAGGAIETVCEGCHLTFWYPNQVIPAFPKDGDSSRPIFRAGTPSKQPAP
jgi:hypothetical protein